MTLAELKQSSKAHTCNLTGNELIEDLKISIFKCSVEIANLHGRAKIISSRVYPVKSESMEVARLNLLLESFTELLSNFKDWLKQLEQ